MLFENFFQYVNDLFLMKTCLLSNPRSKLLPEQFQAAVWLNAYFAKKKSLWSYPPLFINTKNFIYSQHRFQIGWSVNIVDYIHEWLTAHAQLWNTTSPWAESSILFLMDLNLSCFYKYCIHLFQYPNFMNLHVFTI